MILGLNFKSFSPDKVFLMFNLYVYVSLSFLQHQTGISIVLTGKNIIGLFWYEARYTCNNEIWPLLVTLTLDIETYRKVVCDDACLY